MHVPVVVVEHAARVPDARMRDASATDAADFDLLFVHTETTCTCGCGRVGCTCGLGTAQCQSSVVSGQRQRTNKPILRMRSASWCRTCSTVIADVAKAKDCPFELRVIDDENSTESLPRFTWEANGRWWSPTQPGYRGLPDLIAHWRSTQPVALSLRDRPAARSPTPAQPIDYANSDAALLSRSDRATPLEHRIQDIAAAAIRPPPAFGKPGDSPKKSPPLKNVGDTPSGGASLTKSANKSGTNTPPSTPSPGG